MGVFYGGVIDWQEVDWKHETGGVKIIRTWVIILHYGYIHEGEFANGVTQRGIKSKLRGCYFQVDPSLFPSAAVKMWEIPQNIGDVKKSSI